VNRTTRQLEALRRALPQLAYIEFDQRLALAPDPASALAGESARVATLARDAIAAGRAAVVFTRRDRVDAPSAAAQLRLSGRISEALAGVVPRLGGARPAFLVAKGGVTSSDIGVKALRVRRALAKGQILPGVPVWETGADSLFPGLPFVIFPGNVGGDDSLLSAVRTLGG